MFGKPSKFGLAFSSLYRAVTKIISNEEGIKTISDASHLPAEPGIIIHVITLKVVRRSGDSPFNIKK